MKLRIRSTFRWVLLVGIVAALLRLDGITGLRARATRFATTAGAAAKTAVLLLKVYLSLAEQIGEQMVIAIPMPVVVQGDEEQVGAFEIFQSCLS